MRDGIHQLVLQIGTTTGIVTFIYLNGSIDSRIIALNDVLRIDSEQFKVLNLDEQSGRIRVQRGHNNTLQVVHSSGTIVRDDPRKIRFTATGINTSKPVVKNKTLYFMPNESVGLGTATTGTATTITFSNPGTGRTQVELQQQQLFYPDHGLSLNDPLKYYAIDGTSLEVWSGVELSDKYNLTDTRNLFAAPITKDIIGLATDRVSLLVQLLDFMLELIHLKVDYYISPILQVLESLFPRNRPPSGSFGRISQNVVTVSTGETHGMKRGDAVSVDVNSTTTKTIKVEYDDFNRRIVFDKDTIEPSGINTANNTFIVPENKYKTGDKVIYTTHHHQRVFWHLECTMCTYLRIIQSNL